MKCPACQNLLQQQPVDGVTVDVCRGGCGGIWFDNYELKKFDEPHEAAGQELLDVEKDTEVHVDHSQRRTCPKCEDQIMMRHFSCVQRQVEVDACPACGGLWLDQGELGQIRSIYKSEEEQKAAAKQYFSDVFGDQLAELRAESQADLARSRRIAGLFRFLCPSHYISGDQDWGAF